ncbi:MAG: ribonucleotide reductase alpha subunit [Halothiobacillaceae bacterium]|nr:MAG: ribonucleotide reductase alpha subunit [Halothiobacillaceae bacterium]
MKIAPLQAVATSAPEIPLQPASQDIWDKKYRLKKKDGSPVDNTIDDTFIRVARALSEVEASPEKRTGRPSTAPSRALSKIRWMIFSIKCMRRV